ncbi:Piwi-like protein 1 [Orchesella cincta]|uniref:Piwi-like protein 1 n=1 Tax=Orchesella cincta TaxID=48709 RepID=A0A1D2M538_ORCCI|nr:Piwi-like protein 1 [Orchesella cincta]
MNYQRLGRHCFDPLQNVAFPVWRLWLGFNNSIRQQELAIMMNVESCWKVLQTESVFLMAIRQQPPNNFQQACDAAIVGLVVITNNDKQPMLVSKPKLLGQVGDIYLVPELCFPFGLIDDLVQRLARWGRAIVVTGSAKPGFPCGLHDNLRSNFRLMKDLAGCLYMSPNGGVARWRDFLLERGRMLKSAHFEFIQASIKSWNIQLSPKPVELTGRKLLPEEIVCGNSQVTRLDDKADWTNAFRSKSEDDGGSKIGMVGDIVPFDIHHAGPGGGGMSIGAMTATFNESLGRCYSTVPRLSSREEVATAVGAIFEKCLNAYFNKNNRLPERIMMYRDGVGEGQLNAVFNQELEGFQNRIKATYQHQGVKPPKLTYIVVNKRISTRFFEVAGRNINNPRPGFIVDDVVTRPERFSDMRQTLSYYDWTGTVAVPGPCRTRTKLDCFRLAHKLALLWELH